MATYIFKPVNKGGFFMAKTIKIRISENGTYTIEAEEFQGIICAQKVHTVEQLLGGTTIDEGKKDEYYDGGDNLESIAQDLSNLL